jgi:hypothetical protein
VNIGLMEYRELAKLMKSIAGGGRATIGRMQIGLR